MVVAALNPMCQLQKRKKEMNPGGNQFGNNKV